MINLILTATLLMVALVLMSESGNATEYVWARSQNMVGPNRPVSVPGNGYGGYYVPKNAYGNNYEGRPITNPTGFIIPAQTTQPTQMIPVRRSGRRW